MIGAALTAVALWPLTGTASPRWWVAVPAVAFVVVAILRPLTLAPLNRMWTRFGLLLNRFTQPVIMAVVFYGAVTPTALIMRAMKKDPLQRRFDAAAPSYWVERESPDPKSMRNQF